MGNKLTLVTDLKDGILTIYCEGSLVFSCAIQFKTELAPWLTAGIQEIILDLEKVAQIDSAGLGLIAQTQNQTATRGLSFRVVNVPAPIKATFELTGLSARLARQKGK